MKLALPWSVEDWDGEPAIVEADGGWILFVGDDLATRRARMAAIVTAVNNHGELIAACHRALLEAEADDRACVRDAPSQLTLQLHAVLAKAKT